MQTYLMILLMIIFIQIVLNKNAIVQQLGWVINVKNIMLKHKVAIYVDKIREGVY